MGCHTVRRVDVHPALAAPAAALAAAATSAPKARQVTWVAAELTRYAQDNPPARATTAHLLSPGYLAGYLAAADAGTLRVRTPAKAHPDRPHLPVPSTLATARVRRTILSQLAATAGLPDPLPEPLPAPAPAPRPPTRAVIDLLDWLRANATSTDPATAVPAARAAAMLALTLELGLRTSELAALRVDDIATDPTGTTTLTYTPRPPATRTTPAPRTLPLTSPTAHLLRTWLKAREQLTAQTPRTTALWVSLAANHDGEGTRRPPGMPLRPGGVRRAYARTVAAYNTAHATRPWPHTPLPDTPGALRPAPATADPVTAQAGA